MVVKLIFYVGTGLGINKSNFGFNDERGVEEKNFFSEDINNCICVEIK